jgi:chaperonin cofactor prefoldin
MIDLEQKINELQFKITELENKLMMETMVKKSEVELNKELLERAEKHELHIETLIKINEEYSNTISKLRLQLKNLLFKNVSTY